MPGLFDNEDSVFVSKKIDLLSKMLALRGIMGK